jgi:hypothetical protein
LEKIKPMLDFDGETLMKQRSKRGPLVFRYPPQTLVALIVKKIRVMKLICYSIAVVVLAYGVPVTAQNKEKLRSAHQTLVTLCDQSPYDYWNLRADLLRNNPIGTSANPLLTLAGKAMNTVIAKEDIDWTRWAPGKDQTTQRLEDAKPNAKYYSFHKSCKDDNDVSIVWRLWVLTTLSGGLEAITLTPSVPLQFYLHKGRVPSLDLYQSDKDTEAALKEILRKGMSRAEAVEIMKQIGALGRYGELSGPQVMREYNALRYDYKLRRDIGVFPRLALEDVEIVMILDLDESNNVVNVRVP